MEDVSRLQTGHASSNGNAANSPTPIHEAKDSTNVSAWRDWSQERFALETRQDGAVETHARHDGTSGSNLGQPLAFHKQTKTTHPLT